MTASAIAMASLLIFAEVCCVAARAAALVGSLGGSGGPTDGGAAARHSTPHYECAKTCLGRSCDDWTAGNNSSVARETCAKLERQFRCDCGGCICAASAPRRGRRRTTSGECVDIAGDATDAASLPTMAR